MGVDTQKMILTLFVVGFADKESLYDEHRGLTYNQVIERDAKRFIAADANGDEKLDKNEYADFLHPGNHTHWEEHHGAIAAVCDVKGAMGLGAQLQLCAD